ncbi:hypothetical protein [Celeribacter sp.]|uniref:hypothetical protein n=1 Tax=Celeribacter sp. TaxID=1890673 RepID=UPI003A8EF7D1
MSQISTTARAPVTALFAAAPAWSQSAADRLAVSQEYSAKVIADMDMDRTIERMWRPVLDQVQARQGVTFSGDPVEQVRTLYLDTVSEPLLSPMRGNAATMAMVQSRTPAPMGAIHAILDHA